MSIPVLYHFTCEHGHAGIRATRLLRPHTHPLMSSLGPLLWLVETPEPSRVSAGLTSSHLSCVRMAYRYIVKTKAAVRWTAIRARAPAEVVAILESYGKPETWWVARRVLLASEFALDETWKGARA